MTLRLCAVAVENWMDLDGWALGRGLPVLDGLPLDRFVNLIWYWLTRGAEQKDVDRLRAKLWRPPPGQIATKGPWTPEAETSAFKSLKAALGQ